MVREAFLLLVAWLGTVNSLVDEIDYDHLAAMARGAPRDVRSFIDRRMECQHWEGEEPYDKMRRQQIDRAIAKLQCDRIDRDEKRLLKRYVGSPRVIRLIELSQNMSL